MVDFRKMNQNGMQGVPGGPQQMGQQQQPGQMPGDQQDNNPQIMNFLNEANENNWKEESYRNRVSSQDVTPRKIIQTGAREFAEKRTEIIFIYRSDFKLMNSFEMLVKWKMAKNLLNGKPKFLTDLEHGKNMSNLWQH